MNKLKLAVIIFFYSGVASAAKETEAFSKVEDKATEILDFLSGSIVTTILAIALVVAGIGLSMGKGNPKLMWGIIYGAILIGSAAQIAAWLLG